MQKLSDFLYWTEYWGLLVDDSDSKFSSEVFGFENLSDRNKQKNLFEFTKAGTYWGFVQKGAAEFNSGAHTWKAQTGQWFAMPSKDKAQLKLHPDSRVFICFASHHQGLLSMGGPLEKAGRLRYIDGCSDTLLYGPPIKGDPCLNLLHFPPEIFQTTHFHPSSRSGMVVGGEGTCHFEGRNKPLVSGAIFFIPVNLRHNFSTGKNSELDVISFHPDSDWGPTHEVHPMINRTWMND
ncbi:MAG: AraC family ligand binding domain-containing protein [Pseudobdellovibrio sp.]